MDDEYDPSRSEERMAASLDAMIRLLLSGKLKAISCCAVNDADEPSYFYLSLVEGPVLLQPMGALLELYKSNRRFSVRANAPLNNRSSRSH
jgi:hypothetical protein